MTDPETIAAWDAIHDATPAGWYVGRPTFEEHRTPPWSQYAFDPSERARAGLRSREWTAVGTSELRVLCEMARCLREISQGRVPK